MASKYLLYCSYAIAILDLISVLLFAGVSFRLYINSGHWTAIISILFTIFWFCVILLLIIGLWKRRVAYIRAWLIFTCIGIILDAILLIYGFILALSWQGIRAVLLPFIGLSVEITFVYIIYLLYDEWLEKSPTKRKRRCWCFRSKSPTKNAKTPKTSNKKKAKSQSKKKDKRKKKSAKDSGKRSGKPPKKK